MTSRVKQDSFKKIYNFMRSDAVFNGFGNVSTANRENLVDYVINNVNPTSKIELLPSHLGNRYFKNPTTFKALNFGASDKAVIRKIRESHRATLTDSLLVLNLAYVEANTKTVVRLSEFQREFDKLLFQEDLDSRLRELDAVKDKTVIQSLFYIRAYLGAAGRNPQAILKKLSGDDFSVFIRTNFVKNATYSNHFLSFDDDTELDLKSFSALPGTEQIMIEAIKLVLGRAQGRSTDINIQLYFGLRSNPFDAKEIIVSYLERQIAKNGHLSDLEASIFEKIVTTFPCCRTDAILYALGLKPIEFTKKDSEIELCEKLSLRSDVQNVFTKLLSPERISPIVSERIPLRSIAEMRNSALPDPNHYFVVVEEARRFWFTDYGRFLISILTSMYLLKRTDKHTEIVRLNRLVGFQGFVSETTLMSPRGLHLLSGQNNIIDEGGQRLDSVDIISKIESRETHSDRVSVKQNLWNLKTHASNNKIIPYLKSIRQHIKYTAPYFTGVSWDFLRDTELNLGVTPFKGNMNAAYALLLRSIEDETYDFTTLIMIFEKYAEEADSYLEFIDILIEEFGEDAHLFIRVFLSVQTLSQLNFGQSVVETETNRINGIEYSFSKLGETRHINQDYVNIENDTFLVNIVFAHLTDRPFSIPWRLLMREYQELEDHSYVDLAMDEDVYKSISMMKTNSMSFVIHKEHTVSFKYKSMSRYYDLRYATGFIQFFLGHTAHGLEPVLSSRLRHNVLVDEFHKQIELSIKDGHMGLSNLAVGDIIPVLENELANVLKIWINEKIHTRYPAKPNGGFNIIPTQSEIDTILDTAVEKDGDILNSTARWLIARINVNLQEFREIHLADLTSKFKSSLENLSRERREDLSQYSSDAVTKSKRAILAQSDHLVSNLKDWFVLVDEKDGYQPTPDQLRKIVLDRFSNKYRKNLLDIKIRDIEKLNLVHTGPKLKLCFYILTELTKNALNEHKGTNKKSRITISPFKRDNLSGICVSSSLKASNPTPDAPYYVNGLLSDLKNPFITKEGKTGLRKVAVQAAGIVGQDTALHVVPRKNGFHVFVPLHLTSEDGYHAYGE